MDKSNVINCLNLKVTQEKDKKEEEEFINLQ